jgi:hypothetical protein
VRAAWGWLSAGKEYLSHVEYFPGSSAGVSEPLVIFRACIQNRNYLLV